MGRRVLLAVMTFVVALAFAWLVERTVTVALLPVETPLLPLPQMLPPLLSPPPPPQILPAAAPPPPPPQTLPATAPPPPPPPPMCLLVAAFGKRVWHERAADEAAQVQAPSCHPVAPPQSRRPQEAVEG